MKALHRLLTSLALVIPNNNTNSNRNSMLEIWSKVGTRLASLMFIWAMLSQFIPHELRAFVERRLTQLYSQIHPYIEVTIPEQSGDCLQRSEAYTAVKSYLSSLSSASAKRFVGEIGRDGKSVALSMDRYERVEDRFQGVTVWWVSGVFTNSSSTATTRSAHPSADPSADAERKFYRLTCHQKHRHFVTHTYLQHVVTQGKEIRVRNRLRKLHTNIGASRYSFLGKMWCNIPFEHPATFETLAMDSDKKKEIMDDLDKFSKSKDFYARIGKAWKRGYLLYGPPGTGKSTMIAAMANFLKYDVYDLELTAVNDNTELRRLLIETTSKSIIVIEDIDCSLDLTGQRKTIRKNIKNKDDQIDPPTPVVVTEDSENSRDLEKEGKKKTAKNDNDNVGRSSSSSSFVTLSGLLNFIDGIWSTSGGERIIVFTTNYAEKLDPALIRRGRMDKHIEMSYCNFEGFKVLAKNYLFLEDDDHNYHEMFDVVEELLTEIKITPADVAEHLMPKSSDETAEMCLRKLITALQEAKEEVADKNTAGEEETEE